MPRFLTISFIALALVISAAGAAPAAHAAVCSASTAGQSCTLNDGGSAGVCRQNPEDGSYGCGPVITNANLGADAAQTSGAKQSIDPNLGKTAEEGFGKVMIWIMSLFAWLVGVAALTLDYAVYYTVVTMGDYVRNLTAVGVAWRIMRDVGNIMLIFGFLAAGISIIINVDLYGWGQKMLPRLLIAAVFLNFSLFISEAVIDTGNLFATQFYTQINGGTTPTTQTLSNITVGTPGLGANALGNEGISNRIMAQVGLQTIYNAGRVNPEIFKAENIWSIGFMSIILFMVTAFVMFSLAFVLIARFVTLLFLIIISPVGFAGSAVPALAERSKKWWDTLFRQTITAPILLLLLYVALAVITDKKFLTGLCISTDPTNPGCTPNWTGFATGNFQGFASMMLSFLVAMGLLLYVVYKAKDLGAVGASWATRMAGKLTFGATAWAGRNTLGLGSNFLAKQARKRGISRIPILGTNLTRALEYGARSSFDIRGAKVGGGLKATGIDAGKAQEGGYKEELKRHVEARTKYAAELKGKEFKDLSPEQQLDMIGQENAIARLKKQITDEGKAGTLTPEGLKKLNEDVERAENELDTMHEKAGTERGAKLTYGSRLGKLAIPYIGFPTANVDAAKKIKEEARKTKDDKELDALRKALKKAGGDDGAPPPPPSGGGAPPSPPPPSGGGGTPPSH